MISGRGPAAACIERLKAGQFVLLLSHSLLAELREVPLRPELRSRYSQLSPERVHRFAREVQAMCVVIASPPNALKLPRDPDDKPVIDLAVAGNADYIVTGMIGI